MTSPLFTYSHADKVVPNETCPAGGSSISGLAFYPESGGSFPASYRGGLFFADYSRNCIWFMAKGSNGLPDPATRQTFVAGAAGPVDLVIGLNGDLFYPASTAGRSDGSARSQPSSRPRGSSPTRPAAQHRSPSISTGRLRPIREAKPSRTPGTSTADGALDDSTDAAPAWEYTQQGAVTVRLTVTNTSGATGTTTRVIDVAAAANQPPVPDDRDPGDRHHLGGRRLDCL